MFSRSITIARKLLAPQIRDAFESKPGPIKIRLSQRSSKLPPILFVPGSFSGAWVWRGNYLEHFHHAGYEVAAMSFTGHGQRGWQLWQRGLKDFEQDLMNAISEFDTPPILVAHSLGGLIAQRVAQRVPVSAMALLSPIPIDGVARSALSLARKSPLSVLKMAALTFEPRITRFGEAPLGIYSDDVPEETRTAVTARLQAESPLVLMQSVFQPCKGLKPPPCPVQFWGAQGDHIIPASEVQRAAAALGTQARIFPGMSHVFQCEPNWKEVADDVLAWVNNLGHNSPIKLKQQRA